jgi:hypothetical protein
MTADLVLATITRLKATSAVTAIVSTRIYRKDSIPKSPTLPYIVVSDVSDIIDDDTSTDSFASARVRCSCLSSSDRIANQLSKTVRKTLHRTRSTVLSTGTDAVYVISIFDAGDTPDENTEIPLYTYHRDLAIRYSY